MVTEILEGIKDPTIGGQRQLLESSGDCHPSVAAPC